MTYSYQWYRATDSSGTGATAISGAKLASYTLTTSDAHKFVKVVVTANDANGSSTQTADSAYTTIANTAPVNSAVPAISGTAAVGNALRGRDFPFVFGGDGDFQQFRLDFPDESAATKPTWS